MKFLKSLFFLIILILMSVLQAADNSTRVIAFAQDTMKNDFRKAQVFEVRDAAAKYPNLSFVYADGQGQTSLMIRQINQFIQNKVDLIIVGTGDENAVVPVVTKAHEAGIPVIILDRGVKTQNYTTFINSDNIEIGAIGARYIAEKLNGNGLVLLFKDCRRLMLLNFGLKVFLT